MRRLLWAIPWIGLAARGLCAGPAPPVDVLRWSALPPLPPAPGEGIQPGLAGAFAGVSHDALIVAGGANFPERPPWEGGAKVYRDAIHVLVRDEDGAFAWRTDPAWKLPRPLAYGVSATTEQGVACIGGTDGRRCRREAFLLRWDPEAGRIERTMLPPLPRPLAFMGGALAGRTIYVAGGQETMERAAATRRVWALDLAARGDGLAWRERPPWPGPPRVLPVVAAQSDGRRPCLYIFSGREIAPGRMPRVLADGYRFRSDEGTWDRIADVGTPSEGPVCVMGAPAAAFGEYHILVFGGDDGARFTEITRLEASPARRRKLLAEHPGFSRAIRAYHTLTDTWTRAGRLPMAAPPVTTPAVPWDGSIVLPSGEIRPGVRTPAVWRAEARARRARFGALNWGALGLYLAALVAMGAYFARRERTTGDFFLAGRRIPWWAAGISIYGTQLSAITFMAIPATTYRLDWVPYLANVTILAVAPFVAYLYLPFFRRLDVTTAYAYLERRFHVAVRLYGSLSFVLMQLGRMGIVVLLPAMALSAVTGIDRATCILIMGVLCTLYTVMGGIEAVIWTDVLQVAVLLGGAILSFLVIAADVEGGFAGIARIAIAHHKLRLVDWSWDATSMALWVVVIGNFMTNLIPYTADQAVVQRYLTTRDEGAARRAIWTNGLLTIPGSIVFFGIGTALFAFYRGHPGLLDPTLPNDAIFPHFIHQNLPAGLAGLVVAGIFAAAMSSLDSSMNSIATALTTDVYRRFHPRASDRRCLRIARALTVLLGALGSGAALVMASYGGEIRSLWFLFTKLLGLLGGSLAGVFALGIFTRRATAAGALVGAAAGAGTQIAVAFFTPLHFFLYGAVGIASCFLAGYAASLLLRRGRRPIDGLTVHAIRGGDPGPRDPRHAAGRDGGGEGCGAT